MCYLKDKSALCTLWVKQSVRDFACEQGRKAWAELILQGEMSASFLKVHPSKRDKGNF